MTPRSQALQGFAGMRSLREAVHRALGLDPAVATLQMLARVGYATEPTGPSKRRELGALLRT